MTPSSKANVPMDPAKSLELISARLRRLRVYRGYANYEEFAFKFNISRSQVSRHENGSDLRVTSLVRILNALEITLADFFSDDFDDNFPEPKI